MAITLEGLKKATGNKDLKDPLERERIKRITGMYPEEMKKIKMGPLKNIKLR